jgi:hypothetical protein
MKNCSSLLFAVLFGFGITVSAQRPQDNWYLEHSWSKAGAGLVATNGGLSSPYGIAIGTNGNIYVGDQGFGRIQVYAADGTYNSAITNGFGGGQAFGHPRGMITDSSGNLYVADYKSNCVYKFTADGAYGLRFGVGTGSAEGQLNGVIDVAVSAEGQVYVLETINSRLSEFNSDGSFKRILISAGSLDGQIQSAYSVAIGVDGKIYIAQDNLNPANCFIKIFDTNGLYYSKFNQGITRNVQRCDRTWDSDVWFGPCSVRVDPSGLVHSVVSWFTLVRGSDFCADWSTAESSMVWNVFSSDGASLIASYEHSFGAGNPNKQLWPCHAVGSDGSMAICGNLSKSVAFYRRALREQWAPPRNAIPMPAIVRQRQRPNSPLVDIDYQVTDADSANVTVGMLVFTNSSAVASLNNCLRQLTVVEGTATNLGTAILANQRHRVTWNAAVDLNTALGSYRVAVMAKDNRSGLLDIHYLDLPADRGMPSITISRSPLIHSDFMHVWWWLLATNDPGISLVSGKIYGVGGALDGKVLCNGDSNTTADGRLYIYGKMSVREATVAEVQWAREGAVAGNVNRAAPTRQVGGRPGAVNEYGFDTRDWGANAWWIVAQN